jgi:large subunit ribosomal protein L3
MALGLLGKKLGMTHVYDEYGRRRSVTAIQAGPCTVLELREQDTHGYQAVRVGFEPVAEKKLNKAQLGQFTKAGTGAFRYVREFRLKNHTGEAPKVGEQLTVGTFQQYELVDVTGISIGKGFQGGMKRWNWRGGSETHGSMSHRAPGSIGSTTTPGRVWKGHHLPGHMGDARVTIQNLRIVQLDTEHNLILVEGSVPGSEKQLVMISKSVKRPGVIRKPQALQTVVEDEDEKLNKNAKAAKKKA